MPPLFIVIWIGMLLVGGGAGAEYATSQDFERSHEVRTPRNGATVDHKP